MKFVEIQWSPSQRQLLQFGLSCLIAVPLIGWISGVTGAMLGLLVGIGAAIAVAGWTHPGWLRPLFLGMMLIAAPIGMVIGELAMLAIYLGVFVPIALVFRAMRRDALQLKIDRNRVSYWQPKKEPTNTSSYYKRH